MINNVTETEVFDLQREVRLLATLELRDFPDFVVESTLYVH